ncbi:endonuclease domain-containing protein [Roseibacterium beibuensis]|uniref:endonuclease domain-containing protein n=1 Tax=[Roseibacterium] beibuensis TaxID=1193142 RepID=UPI00217DA293|nr:endonuclease domain-containing protein [Roseibacterium beibuensis]MCS6626949.1 endonuclease domain-containing protein [Roseibacterium beibuensis]
MAGARTIFARSQRRKAGLAERRVWELLRGGKIDGHRFRRQHPVGRYFADFACDRLRLIIEIDGGVHGLDDIVLRDHLRQTDLEAMNWTVIRFVNAEVMDHPERVIRAIRSHSAGLNL